MKLKILGMALLACAATSAFAVTNASGTIDGHFTHDGATNNAVITAHDGFYSGSEHTLEFNRLQGGSHATAGSAGDGITCETSEYTGKVEEKTVKTIEVFPVYKTCTTTASSNPHEIAVHTNHCSYTFHSQGARTHGTVTIDCPAGEAIEITHPNCTIRVPAQTTASTLTEGITYDTVVDGGKHALTATVTVNTIQGQFHNGICIFLGTNHKFEMKGSVTVRGYNYVSGKATDHNLVHDGQINITST